MISPPFTRPMLAPFAPPATPNDGRSFLLDAGILDDAGPADEIGAQQLGQLAGLAGDRAHPLLVELLPDVGRAHCLGNLVAQLPDDGLRHTCWADKREIIEQLEISKARLRCRWYLWQRRRPLRTRYHYGDNIACAALLHHH